MTNKELFDMFNKSTVDVSMNDNEVSFDIDLENSGHYGSFVMDIDAEHDSLTLHIYIDGEEYFNATSYDNWDELDSDEQEEYENDAQKIVDQYSKTYPSISTGLSAVYDFLTEINEKDDEPLDDDANEVLEKLFDIFPK